MTQQRSHTTRGRRRFQAKAVGVVVAVLCLAATAAAFAAASDGDIYVVGYTGDHLETFPLGSGYVVDTPLAPPVRSPTAPVAATLAPNGRVLYVSESRSDSVAAYRIGAGGALNGKDPIELEADVDPAGLAVASQGRWLDVTLARSARLVQFALNPRSGLPVSGKSTSVVTGSAPIAVATAAGGRYVYVANYRSGSISEFVRKSSGALAPLSPATVKTAAGPDALYVTPDQTRLYVSSLLGDSVAELTIQGNGQLTATSQWPVNAPSSLTGDSSTGSLYVASYLNSTLTTLALSTTGSIASVANVLSTGTAPSGLYESPVARRIYVTSFIGNTLTGYSLAPNGLPIASTAATRKTIAGPVAVVVDNHPPA